MLKNFSGIFLSIIKLFKYPLILLIMLYGIFMLSYGFFFIMEYRRGNRPEPTSVKHKRRPGFLYSLFIMTPKQMVMDYFNRPADFFSPQGMIVFTGRQGMGKTVSMVEYMLHLQECYPKAKCITNLAYKYEDDVLDDWHQLTDYKNGVFGVIVGMDELQNWFGSNQSRSFPPEMLAVITQNRKNRRIILGTSQNFYLLAKAIRSQATEVRDCMTLFRCFTIVHRKIPELNDKGEVVEWKNRGFYCYAHTKRIREAYDTYAVIDSLAKSGFQEKPVLDLELIV